MWKKILPALIILTAVLALYHPTLTTFFSQDDFFHFKVSQTDGSLKGFFNLFGFYSFQERGIAFYRPISREVPYNLYYSLFGLNHLPFRIFSFLLHFLNIYLLYIFTQRMFQDKNLSFFVSFFFGITAANVAMLYYLAGGIQTLLATTFTLASLVFFHNYLHTKHLKSGILTFISFLLAIASHEQAVIIPFLLAGLTLILKSIKDFKKYFLTLLPFTIVTLLLLLVDIFKIGFSSNEQQYQAVFDLKTTINSFSWYTSWALGVPETLIDFVFPGLKLNPTLIRYWGNYYRFIFPSFFLSIILITFSTVYLFIKNREFFAKKRFLFYLIWYPIGLLPVILLPLHKSTHYLTIVLPAFWTLIGLISFGFYHEFGKVRINLSKIIFSLLIISLLILSSASAILGSTNYWAATRGKMAKKLIKNVMDTYPNLPKGANIYFKNDPTYPKLTAEWGTSSKQANTILNGSDALQLLYKDSTLQAYYEDVKKPTTLLDIFPITAKLY